MFQIHHQKEEQKIISRLQQPQGVETEISKLNYGMKQKSNCAPLKASYVSVCKIKSYSYYYRAQWGNTNDMTKVWFRHSKKRFQILVRYTKALLLIRFS